EAEHWHRTLLAEKGDGYDPRVRSRLVLGAAMTAADYLDVIAARARLIAATDAATADFDVLALPTLVTVPATIAEATGTDDDYRRINLLMLRNSNWVNFLDRCAIALPCGEPGGPPVSLMLVGRRMGDARLFAVAAAVEALFAAR
ncbi:MAG: amidase, partial [Rhodospirillales bacterium]|nr:amidase [Rhodospirillales bacterium]